ncbi:MAG: type II secretion system F family protein [Armatimonadetes bacterium]|nr:type II secretion system F family protein [Armatimonadota bacterium]
MWLAAVVCWSITLGVAAYFLSTRTARDIALGRLEELTQDEITIIGRQEQERDLSGSPVRRLLQAMFAPVGNALKRTSGIGRDVDARLVRAGLTGVLTAGEFVGIKAVAFLFFALVCAVGLPHFHAAGNRPVVLLLIALPLVGFVGPDLALNHLVRQRKRQIRKRLVDVLDLIVLCMEAGIGFEAAMARTAEKVSGPVGEELSQMLGEINHGKARAAAFRDMAARVQLPELSLLVAAVNQADRLGTGLAEALKAQANNIRERNIRVAREAAAKLSVKIVFPLVLCIFPALFIVILGPAMIAIQNSGGPF